MIDTIKSNIQEAIKVGVTAWAVIYLDPIWIQKIIPNAPQFVTFLVSTIICAIILQILETILFGFPKIDIIWKDESKGIELSELALKYRQTNPETVPVKLNIRYPKQSYLASQILKLLTKDGNAHLLIEVNRAPVSPLCEGSSRVTGTERLAVKQYAQLNGFRISLGALPSPGVLWHWAEVRWRDDGTPANESFRINYSFDHPEGFKKLLMNKLIKFPDAVENFKIDR